MFKMAFCGVLALGLVACGGVVDVDQNAAEDDGGSGGNAASSSTTVTTTVASGTGGSGTGGSDQGGGGGSPTCVQLTQFGSDDVQTWEGNAAFACGNSATCLLLTEDMGQSVEHLYTVDGQPLTASALPQETQPAEFLGFLLGTPTGYLASVWKNSGMSIFSWLVRTDGSGGVEQAAPTNVSLNGSASVGSSGLDGEWAASAGTFPQTHVGQYFFGRVDASAQVTQAETFKLNDVYLIQLGGIERLGSTIGISSSWHSLDGTGRISLFLKTDGSSAITEIPLAPPTGMVDQNTNFNHVYQILRMRTVGGRFFIFWKNNLTGQSFVSRVTPGDMPETVAVDATLTDIVPIKGGYAAVAYDQTASAVSLKVFDQDFVEVDTLSFVASGVQRLPIVAYDNLNDGHFALMWVDDSDVAHVVFAGWQDC